MAARWRRDSKIKQEQSLPTIFLFDLEELFHGFVSPSFNGHPRLKARLFVPSRWRADFHPPISRRPFASPSSSPSILQKFIRFWRLSFSCSHRLIRLEEEIFLLSPVSSIDIFDFKKRKRLFYFDSSVFSLPLLFSSRLFPSSFLFLFFSFLFFLLPNYLSVRSTPA